MEQQHTNCINAKNHTRGISQIIIFFLLGSLTDDGGNVFKFTTFAGGCSGPHIRLSVFLLVSKRTLAITSFRRCNENLRTTTTTTTTYEQQNGWAGVS
jgi:hypothetical protein